ncbi:bifunctional Peptidase M1 [Babesia duncani]|uniref:Bifunctional Peptidase M1 n=1 Tax=Babesia duncani TaxID=323732 RepID=A0AAD9PM16_9APIC|nr:bifunctional Peptidase M1 [Babesia duncani]
MATTSGNTTTITEVVSQLTLQPKKEHVEIFRKDYRPPEFDIEDVFLDFDLHDTKTKVTAELLMRRKPNTQPGNLVLHGDELVCKAVYVDGKPLPNIPLEGYSIDIDGNMTIPAAVLPLDDKTPFKVKTEVEINPKDNTKLMGLYRSSRIFCTQCEPHGFRRMTYFLDRPDVLTRFRVRMEADKTEFPILLSNGNKVASGDKGQRHFAEFVDPFPKPCYLFALVAGDLKSISTTFKTSSGNDVKVQLHSEPEDSDKLHWALESLIKAMAWDECAYGREYDLNEFHVVCVRDFNMGAMENKGLNVFNTALLLANKDITTDREFVRIMSVVGHEYFHNWTGNRVTCRDWFQLTLKEGLTVFREAEFCGEHSSPLLCRIQDVKYLMAVQFAEDAGPMSHPIRPESYISMDNFYTPTVYDKGSEVIGMYKTLLGSEGFRKGMDLYFERHDLQAVSCDDFRAAMADANGRDLTQFERWYTQSGTPQVHVLEACRKDNVYRLKLKQTTPPTARQPIKKPFHIPIVLGLVSKATGKDLRGGSLVFELTQEEQTFEIDGINEDCVLSINRNFSAPVKIFYNQPIEEIAFLMGNDSDGFNRWDAAQRMTNKIVLDLAENGKVDARLNAVFMEAFEKILNANIDNDEKAVSIQAPDLEVIASTLEQYNPIELHEAIKKYKLLILERFRPRLESLYEELTLKPNETDTLQRQDMSRRHLRNTLLSYLVATGDAKAQELGLKHFKMAKTMTDRFCGFAHLMNMKFPQKDEVIETFYKNANGDAQVIDKWFRAQATCTLPECLEHVKALVTHKDFSYTNPNRFSSLLGAFTTGIQFHNATGNGYEFIADEIIKVDKVNPQVSARIATRLIKFQKIKNPQQELMIKQLKRIDAEPNLSPNLYEIIHKAVESISSP